MAIGSPVKSGLMEIGSPKDSTMNSPAKLVYHDVEGVEGLDYKICDNCRHKIPLGVYPNHSLSCARRNWFCQACGDAVEKSQKEQHMKDFHTMLFCDCGDQLEIRHMESHKANDCPRRTVRCEYCPLEMAYVEKYEHQKQCGSQTEKCEKCQKYVKKKDLPVHVVDCGKPSSTQTFGSVFGTRSEDMMLCPICDSPFLHLDDLQVHLLTSHPSDSTNSVFTMDDDIKGEQTTEEDSMQE